MKHRLLQACFLLFSALLTASLGAQNTPVKVDVNLLRPSVYPNDLAEQGAAIVTITLLDNRPNYRGILNLTLSNNSGQSVTTPLTAELEVNLTRGVPLVLTGSRLGPFVRLLGAAAGAGLTDNGIVLAEGEQQLCALVFDPLFLGQPISNQELNCSFGFAELHEPPTPISPVDEEVAISPLQDAVNFLWAPNYFAGPVINYLTIWDVPREWAGVTPDIIISSLEPIRQPLRVPEINAISKLWTTGDADLIPGHRYLYQLQATDPTGRVRFRNNGYARPVFFEYTYPTPSTDQLCYEPDELALAGNNGNYQLNWTGYALDSVNHTISVVTLPERRFVLQSELLTTPTFPTRQLVNGGPRASFSYDIDVDLDTTNRQAYLVTLCTVCSLTGEEFCREVVLGTPGEPGPDGECPTEDDLLAGVTVSALLPDRILADWSGAFPGTDPNGWSASINEESEDPTSETAPAPPTSPFGDRGVSRGEGLPAPAAAPSNTTFSALNPNSSYVITVCYACPGGATTCADWTLDLNGNDDCLTSLNFTRPDSTETTLDLAWTYTPGTVPASDSFQLIWQVSDRSAPETMATVAYADGTFTIEDRIPGQAYTLRVCAECTAGRPVCRELLPFGGCVAEYLPELMDLRGRHALLSWHGDDRNLETQVRYGMRNLGGWENAQPVSSQNFTAANYDRPEDQLVQTAALYATTYVGQVRTACADSLWSEWSEPILFSRSCALALTDSLHVWEITDSNALVTGQVLPQAQNYVFSYRQTGTQAWILSTDLPTPDILLTGLSADTEYEVKLRYRCGGGVWSNFSQVFTFRTLTPCIAPENISFSDVTASSVVISWTTENYVETTLFRYRIAGGSSAWQTVTFAGNSGMLSDLAPGEAYEIEAVSHCAANNSYASAPQSLVLSCAPPELRVTDVTVSSAQLQALGLSPAAASNGFAYRVVGAADWIRVDSAYLTGLDDLTEYEARARTTCTSGENSEWSDPVRFETPVDCRVPNELGVTSLSTVSAGLRWATTGSNERWEIRLLEEGAADRLLTLEQTATFGVQEADDGLGAEGSGGLYGGGGVYNNPTPPDPYADWRLITSDSPEVLVEGLKAYTDYRIVVRTYCPTNGWTDYSEDLLLRTLCATQPADSLYADQILEDRARLRFQPDTRCQIENEIVLEHPETMYADASTQSVWYHTFTNLQPNTVYRFKVRTKAESYAFTPAANGYTTMADVGTSIGSAGGADAGARVVGEAGWTAFSDWQTFRTDDCAPPYDFVENTLDQSTIEITWAASNGINTYEFKYKLADDLGSDWAYLNVSEPYVRLENILRGTLYDYQVTELCQNGQTFQPAPQDTFLLKRESRNNGFYACGVESNVDLSNEVPLGSLAVGDTITAFDFPVVITSVSGSGGNFSGEGEIRVPYFNKAKATFSFDGIFVNDDYQMKGGKLVAIGAGVEVLPPWADELLAEVMGALQMLDAYLEEEQLELLDSLMSCCSATLPAELRQRIFDLQNCYAAQAEQNQPNYSLCADMLEALMADIQAFLDAIYGGTFQVTFSAAPDQTYGFDGYNDGDGGRRQNWYETDTLAKEPYPIAFKSIKAGDSDRVLAEIPFSGGPTNVYQDSIGYELPTGTIPGYSYPDAVATTATLTVPTASGTDENFFLAATQIDPSTDSIPPFIAGLLDVIPYEELTPTLRIIETTPGALDGLDSAAVQQRIRDIYAQAVVKPTVEYVRFAEAVDYIPQDYEAPLQAVPSGWLTPYTQQMKSFRRNYLDKFNPEDDEYIFFVFGKNASGEDSFEPTDRLGFMPPGRRFSFIYRNDNKNTNVADFGRTIAHELGHGAYVLRHPWTYPENDDRYVAQSNDTRNLMDGNGGTELWKWQWDLIHDPEGAPFLPGDEDGESQSVTDMTIFDPFRNTEPGIKGTLTFISPAGKAITIPADVKSVTFNSGDEISIKEKCFSDFDLYLFGSLSSFVTAEGTRYNTWLNCDNTANFYGYGHSTGEDGPTEWYHDNFSKLKSESNQDFIRIILRKTATGYGWGGQKSRTLSAYSDVNLTNYKSSGSRHEYLGYPSTPTADAIPLEGFINNQQFTNEAIDFLNLVAQSSLPNWAASFTYAFAHAHQMSRYPALTNSCPVKDVVGVDLDRYTRILNGIYNKTDNIEADRQFGFSLNEMRRWKFGNKSVYKKYQDAHDKIYNSNWLDNLAENPTAANALMEVLVQTHTTLNGWLDLPIDIDHCLFSKLPIDKRIKILKVLSHKKELSEYFILGALGGQTQEHYYNYLIASTPEEDADYLYSVFMAYNGNLYWRVYEKMNDPLWITGRVGAVQTETFVANIYKLFLKEHSGLTLLPAAGQLIDYNPLPSGPQLNSIYVDRFYSIEGYLNDPINKGPHYAIPFGLDKFPYCNSNQIVNPIVTDHIYTNVSPTYVITLRSEPCVGMFNNTSGIVVRGTAERWSVIEFTQDVAFNYIGGAAQDGVTVAAGTKLVVPLFFAKFLLDKQIDATGDFASRVVIDVIGAALATYAVIQSGGTVLMTISALDAAYNLGDLAMANYDYQVALTGRSNEQIEKIKNIWNVIGLISAGGSSFTILKFAGGKFVLAWDQLQTAAKTCIIHNEVGTMRNIRRGIAGTINALEESLQSGNLTSAQYFAVNGQVRILRAQKLSIEMYLSAVDEMSLDGFKLTTKPDDLSFNVHSPNSPTPSKIGNFVRANENPSQYVLEVSESTLISSTDGFDEVGSFENVLIKTTDGTPTIAKIKLLTQLDNNTSTYRIFIESTIPPTNTLALRFPGYYRMFQQNKALNPSSSWDFDIHFTPEIANILSHTPNRAANWLRIFDELPPSQASLNKFTEIFDDISRTVVGRQMIDYADDASPIVTLLTQVDSRPARTLMFNRISNQHTAQIANGRFTGTSWSTNFANLVDDLGSAQPNIRNLADRMLNPAYASAILDDIDLLNGFKTLQNTPTLLDDIDNFRTLKSASKYFKYKFTGRKGYDGLQDLFGTESSNAGILSNLRFLQQEINFNGVNPDKIYISGVKTGGVRLYGGDNVRLAKIENGTDFLPDRFTSTGTHLNPNAAGGPASVEVDGLRILEQNGSYGFVYMNNTAPHNGVFLRDYSTTFQRFSEWPMPNGYNHKLMYLWSKGRWDDYAVAIRQSPLGTKFDELQSIFPNIRKNINYLNRYEIIDANTGLKKHIFKGDLEYGNTPSHVRDFSGVHAKSAITVEPTNLGPFSQGDLRFKAGTKKPVSAAYTDYYEAKVEVYGTNYTPAGIPTEVWRSANRKTFFPDSWSEQKIIAEITHGFQNKVFQSTTPSNGSSIYLGTMSDGISIFIIVGSDGKIITAYPKI